MTADDGPGTIETANRGGRHLVNLDSGESYWEPMNEVTPLVVIKEQEQNDWRNETATERQISYLIDLGVSIEYGMTKGRASQLIEAAKQGILGSAYGFYTDGSN